MQSGIGWRSSPFLHPIGQNRWLLRRGRAAVPPPTLTRCRRQDSSRPAPRRWQPTSPSRAECDCWKKNRKGASCLSGRSESHLVAAADSLLDVCRGWQASSPVATTAAAAAATAAVCLSSQRPRGTKWTGGRREWESVCVCVRERERERIYGHRPSMATQTTASCTGSTLLQPISEIINLPLDQVRFFSFF